MVMRNVGMLLVTAGLLAGCADAPGHMYPVEGVLATQTPVPVFLFQPDYQTATVKAEQVYSGPRVILNPMNPAAGGLQAEWDHVYGPGFFVANILGVSSVWHYTLTGARGGHMEIEVITARDSQTGITLFRRGVARDSQGNVFKVAF
jgi:hypothetical protein